MPRNRVLNDRLMFVGLTLILVAACASRISQEVVEPTTEKSTSPATPLSSPRYDTPESTADEQACQMAFERHEIPSASTPKGDQPRYTLSEGQLDKVLLLMGIETICLPPDWGAPFVITDWYSKSGTALSGRMLSLGFESRYAGAGWSDAVLIYATYNFAAGTEYDVFATEEDRDALRQESMAGMLSVDGVQGFSRPFASLPMGLQDVWQTVVFPFEDHYLAAILRLGAFEPGSIAETMADFNAGKLPEEMLPDLARMDALVNSIRFFKIEDAQFTLNLVANQHETHQINLADPGSLELQEPPLISEDDILHYDLDTHEIELTAAAFARVLSLFTLPIDSDGIPFVVSVSGEPVYAGALYSPASSLSFGGVVILHPIGGDPNTITLSLGYPSREAFEGQDPRSDPRVIEAFEPTNP